MTCTGWPGVRLATTSALEIASRARTKTATPASTATFGRAACPAPDGSCSDDACSADSCSAGADLGSSCSDITGVPGAACTPRTASPGGTPAAVPCQPPYRTTRRHRTCRGDPRQRVLGLAEQVASV